MTKVGRVSFGEACGIEAMLDPVLARAHRKRMRGCAALLALLVIPACLGSCGFWNPDPAERLGLRMAREARELERSGEASTSFAFVPDARRVSRSPRFNGKVEIRAVPMASGRAGGSVLVVSDWFTTTYHSRFVRVSGELKATKRPGEAFELVLRKSGGVIEWTAIR